MFIINDDLSIYANRGDIVFFTVSADDNGTTYKFQPGDIVRMAIYGRKDAEACVLQKDFPVTEVCETVFIYLEEKDTKIGEIISKQKDYWYEVVLNPDTMPQTIIGYDEDGPKIFRLFPESSEIDDNYDPQPEDFPVVDEELDMTSPRPVANQAIARAVATILDTCERTNTAVAELHVTPQMFGAIGDGKADDTEAIQLALNSVSNIVYLPFGKYRVTGDIEIPENKTLLLEGEVHTLSGVSDLDVSAIAISGDASIILNNGSRLLGGMISAPESSKVVLLDVGTKTMKNIEITTAILGARRSESVGVYFQCSSGTKGSLCFSKFKSAIHGFHYGYFVDRPSGNLPWFTFCEFEGVLSENYKAFTHNLTNYGSAFGSSRFRFVVCGGYIYKNSESALLDMIGDNLTIDCKFSDIGAGHNHVYALDLTHVQKSTIHNIPYQSPLILAPSKNRNNFVFGEMGTVENEHGTLSYIVNGMVAHVFYRGDIPVGSTYIAVPFSCLAFAKNANGNTSIETQQHFPNVILKNSGTEMSKDECLSLSIIIH